MKLEQVREILGDEAIGMDDDSLTELVCSFADFAKLFIRHALVLK